MIYCRTITAYFCEDRPITFLLWAANTQYYYDLYWFYEIPAPAVVPGIRQVSSYSQPHKTMSLLQWILLVTSSVTTVDDFFNIRLSNYLHGHYSQCYFVHRYLDNAACNKIILYLGNIFLAVTASNDSLIQYENPVDLEFNTTLIF